MAHALPFRRLTNRSAVSSDAAVTFVQLHIRGVMLRVCKDPMLLLEVVGGGPALWRQRLVAAFAPFPVDDTLANRLFYFFCCRVIEQYGAPGMEIDDAFEVASRALDSVEQQSAPTEAEIDAAWEVDDASSPEGRRYFYGDRDPVEDLRARLTTVH